MVVGGREVCKVIEGNLGGVERGSDPRRCLGEGEGVASCKKLTGGVREASMRARERISEGEPYVGTR